MTQICDIMKIYPTYLFTTSLMTKSRAVYVSAAAIVIITLTLSVVILQESGSLGGYLTRRSPFSPCGNGRIDAKESCDDGNRNNNDGCLDGSGGSCKAATCGDGYVW